MRHGHTWPGKSLLFVVLASFYVSLNFKYYCLTILVSIIAWLFVYNLQMNCLKADDFRHIALYFIINYIWKSD